MEKIEKDLKEIESLALEILKHGRMKLYFAMRFFDVALCSLEAVPDWQEATMGVDGQHLFFHPNAVLRQYKEEEVSLYRLYFHQVLHCLFRHLFRRKNREEALYDLSCDIVVESVIDGLSHRCLKKRQSWIRRETYRKLRGQMKTFTAEKVYSALESWDLSLSEMLELQVEFHLDTHTHWPKGESPQKSPMEQKWEDIAQNMETDLDVFAQEAAGGNEVVVQQVRVENRKRYDYQKFLRKFMTLREEMQVDVDSFDYGFYTYGLTLYGNMPLIEPQEWKEIQKIEEFVIVVDTSMSCSGELVRRFLEETYSILTEKNTYFQKVNIRIIQCDDRVQREDKIQDMKELEDYMNHFTLQGEGGTDFRPAFSHIQALIEAGAFQNLKGCIYFTDGKGSFPRKKPPFQTAFVFLQEEDTVEEVPPWAMKLIMEESDFDRRES